MTTQSGRFIISRTVSFNLRTKDSWLHDMRELLYTRPWIFNSRIWVFIRFWSPSTVYSSTRTTKVTAGLLLQLAFYRLRETACLELEVSWNVWNASSTDKIQQLMLKDRDARCSWPQEDIPTTGLAHVSHRNSGFLPRQFSELYAVKATVADQLVYLDSGKP